MDTIQIRIGENFKKLRQYRKLSLDKVAELTGVSKAMLHQIEKGDTQPTVTTLWKMATGLNVSFSSFLQEGTSSIAVVRQTAEPVVLEDEGRCAVYMLFPFDPTTRLEMLKLILQPGCQYVSPPHRDGVVEHITVMSGMFTATIGDDTFELTAGEAVRFAGHVTHRYCNATSEPTTIHVVMAYGE